MKVGILGSGFIVPLHMDTIEQIEGIEDAAICCLPECIDRAKELAAAHGVKKVYTDYRQMLQDPEIDVVYIAVPNHLHYPMSKQALQAKKHVMCEKPFVLEPEQADDLFQTANDNGVMIIEAITTRYLPNFLAMKQKLNDMGDIKIVQCNYSQYSSRYDAFQQGTILPAFDPRQAGGALMDINIYNLHFVIGLFGRPQTVRYFANIERNIDTSGIVILQYPTFQAVCVGAKDCMAPGGINIQGNRGTLHTDHPVFTLDAYQVCRNKKEPETYNENDSTWRMLYEWKELMRMIETDDQEAYQQACLHSRTVVETAKRARQDAGLTF